MNIRRTVSTATGPKGFAGRCPEPFILCFPRISFTLEVAVLQQDGFVVPS